MWQTCHKKHACNYFGVRFTFWKACTNQLVLHPHQWLLAEVNTRLSAGAWREGGRGAKPRQGEGWPGKGDNRGGLCRTLTPTLCLKTLHGATRICTSNVAGAGLSSPIGILEHYTGLGGNTVDLQPPPNQHWIQRRSLGLAVPLQIRIRMQISQSHQISNLLLDIQYVIL